MLYYSTVMQAVTKEDVLSCAKLAVLNPDGKEIEPLRADMEQLLACAQKLDCIAVGAELPSPNDFDPKLHRREDIAMPSLTQSEALANAPDQCNGYFVVPKIM